jgi:putative ABC transport system permease protein
MFGRMLGRSYSRGRSHQAIALVTITFAAALASAVIAVTLDVGDKINRELKAYGANLVMSSADAGLTIDAPGGVIEPVGSDAAIAEEKLPIIKTVFWRHNIVDFAPELDARATLGGERVRVAGTWFDKTLVVPTGETIRTGAKQLMSWWNVRGEWPGDGNEARALVQTALADRLGLTLGQRVTMRFDGEEQPGEIVVAGFLDNEPDGADIYLPLDYLQTRIGAENRVTRVMVSALTNPEDALSRTAATNPTALSGEEYERWYCTPYVESIATQLEEAIPGVKVRQIRKVAQSEGRVLGRIRILMVLLAGAGILSAILGVQNLMTANILERSREIGLMKALGAGNLQVARLFLSEAILNGLLGGLAGYGIGYEMARFITTTVFSSPIAFNPIVIPATLLLSVFVAFSGSAFAMKNVVRLDPTLVLHGR